MLSCSPPLLLGGLSRAAGTQKNRLPGGARIWKPPGIHRRLGEGSALRPAVPSASAALPTPSPWWGMAMGTGTEQLTAPRRPALGNSARAPTLPAAGKLQSVHIPLCCPWPPRSVKVYPGRPCSPSPGKSRRWETGLPAPVRALGNRRGEAVCSSTRVALPLGPVALCFAQRCKTVAGSPASPGPVLELSLPQKSYQDRD